MDILENNKGSAGKTITVYLNLDLYDQVLDEVSSNNTNMSRFVAKVLSDYFKSSGVQEKGCNSNKDKEHENIAFETNTVEDDFSKSIEEIGDDKYIKDAIEEIKEFVGSHKCGDLFSLAEASPLYCKASHRVRTMIGRDFSMNHYLICSVKFKKLKPNGARIYEIISNEDLKEYKESIIRKSAMFKNKLTKR